MPSYTTATAGSTITAALWNANVRDGVVNAFGNAAARDSAITSPVVGMLEYLASNDVNEGLTARNSANKWALPWNLAWGVIGYASVTANQSGITTATDLTGLTTGAITLPGNRRYSLSFECYINSTVNGDIALITIQEGATVLQSVYGISNIGANSISGSVIITPTGGAHTYKLTMVRIAGTGSHTMYASTTAPAFILLQDLGPVGAPA